MWHTIRSLREGGTTVLLTTQYLDEADELADEIVVIDRGVVIAAGTAESLKGRVGGDVLEFTVLDRSRMADAATAVKAHGEGEPATDAENGLVSVRVGNRGSDALIDAVRGLDGAGIRIRGLLLRRPSLNDAFLALTGRAVETESIDRTHGRGRRRRAGRQHHGPDTSAR
jgi:ABC-2 type transport system ATP-binding protein